MSLQSLELLNLPTELHNEILLNLPLESLLKACETSSYFRNICNDDRFWRDKTLMDYKDIAFYDKPQDLNWKKYYIKLYYSKSVPIYSSKGIFNTDQHVEFKGNIRIFKDQTIDDIKKEVLRLYKGNNFIIIYPPHVLSVDNISFIKISPTPFNHISIYLPLTAPHNADFDGDEVNIF